MSRRDERRARRQGRKDTRATKRADRKEARGGTSFQRKAARKLARTEKGQSRRDARMQGRQQRVEARKAKGLAKIAAKESSGFWSAEAVQARQNTLGGALDMGGELLGSILGSDETAAEEWNEGGYSEAAAFEGAYPDEFADEMGQVIPFDGGQSEEEGYPWSWIAAGAGAGLVGLYMVTRSPKKRKRKGRR